MNITTLNITADTIKALSRQGAALKKQEAPLSPGSVKNGLILQSETVGRDIKQLFHTGRLSSGSVVCTISGLPFTYRVITIPGMEAKAFHEAVIRTARKELSVSADEMYLSWQAYPQDNGEYHVLVAGITRHPVDSLIKALSAAGISPWLLDLPHLALARMCPQKDAVIVDFGRDCSNIVIIADGVPRGLHMVPALAEGASLQDQVTQVMDKLAKMVEFYNGSHPSHPVKENVRIFVAGELLEDENAFEYIKPVAGFSLEPLACLRPALSGRSIRPVAVNAGMLDIRQGSGKNAALSRPLDMGEIIRQRRRKSDVRGLLKKITVPLAVTAGIAVLALSSLTWAKQYAEIRKLQESVDIANSVLTIKQAEADEAGLLESQIEDISLRIAEINAGREEIFMSRGYVDDIASIVACMPEGITFDSLDMDAEEINLCGSAADTSPVIEFADRLEASGDFSEAVITWIDSPRAIGEENHYNFELIITRS